jgi:hypothetical protein
MLSVFATLLNHRQLCCQLCFLLRSLCFDHVRAEELKAKHPHWEWSQLLPHGKGLSNVDYAHIAIESGRCCIRYAVIEITHSHIVYLYLSNLPIYHIQCFSSVPHKRHVR